MAKRFLLMFIAAILAWTGLSSAEGSFLDTAEEVLASITDLSDKQVFTLQASGYSPDLCIVQFDFTEGNQTIVAVEGDRCRLFFFFEDEELLSLLYRMIAAFDALEKQLPAGKKLQYDVRFSEEETCPITGSTIAEHFSWALK